MREPVAREPITRPVARIEPVTRIETRIDTKKEPIYYADQAKSTRCTDTKKNQCVCVKTLVGTRCDKCVETGYLCEVHANCRTNIYGKQGTDGVEEALQSPDIDMSKPYPPYYHRDSVKPFPSVPSVPYVPRVTIPSVVPSIPVVIKTVSPARPTSEGIKCTNFNTNISIPISEEMFEYLKNNPKSVPSDITFTQTHMIAKASPNTDDDEIKDM